MLADRGEISVSICLHYRFNNDNSNIIFQRINFFTGKFNYRKGERHERRN